VRDGLGQSWRGCRSGCGAFQGDSQLIGQVRKSALLFRAKVVRHPEAPGDLVQANRRCRGSSRTCGLWLRHGSAPFTFFPVSKRSSSDPIQGKWRTWLAGPDPV